MAKAKMTSYKSLTITVTIPRRLQFRVWLGMQFIKLGTRIATFSYKQETLDAPYH